MERIFLSMRDDNGPGPHVSEPPAVAATRNPQKPIRAVSFQNPSSVLAPLIMLGIDETLHIMT